MFVVALTLTNSSLSGDVAAGGPARAARLQLGQEGLLHRLLQRDALQIKKIYFNTASKYLLHILSTVGLLLNEQIYLGRLVAEHLAYQVEHFVPVLVSSHLATYLYVRTQLQD